MKPTDALLCKDSKLATASRNEMLTTSSIALFCFLLRPLLSSSSSSFSVLFLLLPLLPPPSLSFSLSSVPTAGAYLSTAQYRCRHQKLPYSQNFVTDSSDTSSVCFDFMPSRSAQNFFLFISLLLLLLLLTASHLKTALQHSSSLFFH